MQPVAAYARTPRSRGRADGSCWGPTLLCPWPAQSSRPRPLHLELQTHHTGCELIFSSTDTGLVLGGEQLLEKKAALMQRLRKMPWRKATALAKANDLREGIKQQCITTYEWLAGRAQQPDWVELAAPA